MAEQLGIPREHALNMNLGQLRGWILAARIARHELAGGAFDYESGEFVPIPTAPAETE